jgi:hypothetical protein
VAVLDFQFLLLGNLAGGGREKVFAGTMGFCLFSADQRCLALKIVGKGGEAGVAKIGKQTVWEGNITAGCKLARSYIIYYRGHFVVVLNRDPFICQ